MIDAWEGVAVGFLFLGEGWEKEGGVAFAAAFVAVAFNGCLVCWVGFWCLERSRGR
jgi:hypothetical protein